MHRRRRHITTAIVAALAIGTISVGTAATAGAGESGSKEIVWGLEAETTSGYCLPNARLAAAGIQVATAVYDSLMAINSKGEYVPYLAESFTPNATFDEWTIKLREGITFHNGEPLDAEALKLNIDSFRGENPDVPPQLFLFVFEDIDTVTVVDPLTVSVTTKKPWVAFPAFWSGGRTGISAPEQLAAGDGCTTNLIGTGPFRFVEFRQNESLTVEKNPDYWREGFPKVDKITFKPVPDAQVRNNGLVSGDLDVIQAGGATTLRLDDLEQKAEAGELQVLVSEAGAETSYVMLNTSKPPFDDPIARQAVAFAGDAREVNDIRNKGKNTISTGPFPPDHPSYLDRRAAQAQPEEGEGAGGPVRGRARGAPGVGIRDQPRARRARHRAAREGAEREGRHRGLDPDGRPGRAHRRRAGGQLPGCRLAEPPRW